MKTVFLSLFLVFFGIESIVFSQSDTIWLKYQNDGQEMKCSRESHEFYRVVTPNKDNKFTIKDYYKNDILKRLGISDVMDDQHFIGDVKHFHNNGKLFKVGIYKSYTEGVNVYFSNDSIKTVKVEFTNHSENGIAEFYDKAGNVIAEPKYKDGRPFEGLVPMPPTIIIDSTKYSFFNYKNGDLVGYVRSFKNGVKACEAFTNRTKLDSALYFYPNGTLIGKCTYLQNNIPFNGTHVDYYGYSLNSKYVDFYNHSNFSQYEAIIQYISKISQGKIIERISYDHKGNKIGECIYKDGHPYSGQVLEKNELKFYDNQTYYFNSSKVYDNKMENVIYEYLSEQDKKYGKTSFFYNDSTYIGEFENNNPLNGTVFFKNELCQYHNNKKVGWCINFNKDWQITEQYTYVEDKKEGPYFSTYFDELDTLKGVFYNDKPYTGSFISNKYKPEIHKFNDGVLQQKLAYNHKLRLVSKECVDSGFIVFYKTTGDTLCSGKMNKGKPFSGVFWDHIQNTLTRFESGLLNGLKEYFDGNNKLTKSEPYINGTIEGEVTFYFNNKEYRCIYTNGNPFEGTILNEKNELVTFHEGKPY